MRRMIDLTRGKRDGFITLDAGFREDVAYWTAHLDDWNGTALWSRGKKEPFVFGSDASTGGFASGLESCPHAALSFLPDKLQPGHARMGVWSLVRGDAVRQGTSSQIQWGEMYSPLAAVAEYGSLLADSHVVFGVDNEADVHAINRPRGREPRVCRMIRGLCDMALQHNFTFKAVHREGERNSLMSLSSVREQGLLDQLVADLGWLVSTCKFLHISSGSRTQYSKHHRIFFEFCDALELDPFALTEEQLCLAVVHFSLGHTSNSVPQYMSAVLNLYDGEDAGKLPRGASYSRASPASSAPPMRWFVHVLCRWSTCAPSCDLWTCRTLIPCASGHNC